MMVFAAAYLHNPGIHGQKWEIRGTHIDCFKEHLLLFSIKMKEFRSKTHITYMKKIKGLSKYL